MEHTVMNKNQDSSTRTSSSSTILDRLETTLHACSLETLYTSSITTSRNRCHHNYYPLVIGCYQLHEEPTVTTTEIETEQDENEKEDEDENQLSTVIQVQGDNNTNNNNNNNTTIRRSGELILYSIKIPNQDVDDNDDNEENKEGVFKFGQEQQRLDTGIRGGVLDGKWLQYHKFRFENEEEEEETEMEDETDTDNEELLCQRQQPSLSAGVSSSSSSSYMFATANASGTINIYRLLDDDEQTRKDDNGDGNTGANNFEEGPSSSSNLRLQCVGSSSDSTSSNDKKENENEKEKEKDDIGLALSLAWDESSSASLSTLLSTATSSTLLSSDISESPTTAATKTIQHDSSISATTGQNLLPCLSHCCSSRRIVSSYSKGTIAVHTITAPTTLSSATNDSLSLVNVQETHRWKNAHTFFGMPSEVWTVCFATNRYYNTHADTIISGGDDCTMKVWDLRLCGESSSNPTHHPIFVQKDFTAGVTAVAYHPSCEHLFAVGSYDESVKVYDMRKLSTAVAYMPTVGGGVWRLKWHPTLRHRILIGAMHGGCRIVDIGGGVCGGNDDGNRVSSSSSSSSSFSSTSSEEEIRNMHIVKEFTEHKSMAYGADWIHSDKLGNHPEKTASIHTSSAAASCSFYDRQVFLWK